MSELNKITCGDTSKGNTGVPSCFFDPGLIKGIILTSPGFKITKVQMATSLLSTLKTATHASRGSRIFPLLNFEDIADKTEDPTIETLGYGRADILFEKQYNFDFTYLDGGLCLSNQLRLFNGKKWSAFLVDDQGVLIGVKSGDDLLAIPLKPFYAKPFKIATGSTAAKYMINIQFEQRYINEQIGFTETINEFNIFDEVKGLINALLVELIPLSAGKVRVQVIESCGGQNLYDLYNTNLTQLTAWVGKNATTNNIITITTVATVPASKSFDVTLDTADVDYPTAGNKLTLELATPAVLSVAPINLSGFENVNFLLETV